MIKRSINFENHLGSKRLEMAVLELHILLVPSTICMQQKCALARSQKKLCPWVIQVFRRSTLMPWTSKETWARLWDHLTATFVCTLPKWRSISIWAWSWLTCRSKLSEMMWKIMGQHVRGNSHHWKWEVPKARGTWMLDKDRQYWLTLCLDINSGSSYFTWTRRTLNMSSFISGVWIQTCRVSTWER